MKKLPFSNLKLLLIGSGELGKEIVIEAQRLGCEVIAVDKYSNAPAMQVADKFFVIDMSNKEFLKNLINDLQPDYVIPEIESLSIEALKELETEGIKIVPNARTVEMTMNREKIRDLAFSDLKIKTANYRHVYNFEDLKKNAFEIGFPLLLKPLMSSSGKGQNLVNKVDDLENAWNTALSNSRGNVKGVILEEYIDFSYEFTLLTVRTNEGKTIFCPPIGHEQKNGDYQCSWQPILMNDSIIDKAKIITNKILDNLNGAGIYGVEFFVKQEDLFFSELSPRPHDTGMVTLLSQNINEFELHLRALLDLPIPEIELTTPAATRVILSNNDYSDFGFYGIHQALKIKNTKVLIFGKPVAKRDRRMGVVLASGKDITEARARADNSAREIKIQSLEEI
tara:strand:- start:3715 stop:4899 length:1185 start_codon:yes stop_codon:yes gene_type:complete